MINFHKWSTLPAHSPDQQWFSLEFDILEQRTTCVNIIITTGSDRRSASILLPPFLDIWKVPLKAHILQQLRSDLTKPHQVGKYPDPNDLAVQASEKHMISILQNNIFQKLSEIRTKNRTEIVQD